MTELFLKGNLNKVFFLSIIKALPNYVFIKDRHLIYQACNHNFLKFAGLTEYDEVIGKDDLSLPWSKSTAHIYRQEDQQIIDSKQSILAKEVPMGGVGEDEKTLLVSKTPLLDEHSDVLGILGIYIDITERKHLESNLVKALSAKTEFIANISHDIRTPITGMLGLLDTLQQSVSDPSQQKDIQLLTKTTRELLVFLNDVLSAVGVQNRTIDEQAVPFSLKMICQRQKGLLDIPVKNAGLAFEFHVADDLPDCVIGNKVYLERILLNLLGNAIKFTTQGKISFTVSQEKITKNTLWVRFVIEDTGPGIPAKDQEKIFEPFAQLATAYSSQFQGNGLGLYLVRKAVDSMQGQITLNSTPGKGSCFVVTLPFEMRHVESEEAIQGESNFSDTKTLLPPEEEMSCLIIEDNYLASRMAKQLLMHYGVSADCIQTSAQALEHLNSTKYTFILMDIGLGEQDGYEVATIIRDWEATQNNISKIPIFALTAFVDDAVKVACAKAGMDDVLEKPLKTDAIEYLLGLLKKDKS